MFYLVGQEFLFFLKYPFHGLSKGIWCIHPEWTPIFGHFSVWDWFFGWYRKWVRWISCFLVYEISFSWAFQWYHIGHPLFLLKGGGGSSKTNIERGDCLKRGPWTVWRFKGGLARKRGGVFQGWQGLIPKHLLRGGAAQNCFGLKTFP